MNANSRSIQYALFGLIIVAVIVLVGFAVTNSHNRAPMGDAPPQMTTDPAPREVRGSASPPPMSLPAKSAKKPHVTIDWSEVEYRLDLPDPKGPLPRLKWVAPPKPHELTQIVFTVEQLFHRMDTNDIFRNGRMLEHARAITTREDAKARWVDCEIFSTAAGFDPAKGFETPDYYILTYPVRDYNRKLRYYIRTRPPEEHPICDFLEGGYAIRKADGHAIHYSRDTLEVYLREIGQNNPGPPPPEEQARERK